MVEMMEGAEGVRTPHSIFAGVVTKLVIEDDHLGDKIKTL